MIRSVIMNIFVDNDVRDSTQIRMATLLRGLKKRMFRLFETTRGYDIDRQTDRRTRWQNYRTNVLHVLRVENGRCAHKYADTSIRTTATGEKWWKFTGMATH